MDESRPQTQGALGLRPRGGRLPGGRSLYTSFSASSEAAKPSELREGRSYELTGKVVAGSIQRDGDELRFEVRDRDGHESVPVAYAGVVPGPFREGREVIVSGELKQRHVLEPSATRS